MHEPPEQHMAVASAIDTSEGGLPDHPRIERHKTRTDYASDRLHLFALQPTLPDVSIRFGRRVRDYRRERNLTQVQMAVDFGIDRSFISDVERGKKAISLPFIDVIALGMGVSLSELLHDL